MDFVEGQRIFSKYFGPGKIITRYTTKAVIQFDNFRDSKVLDVDYILDYSFYFRQVASNWEGVKNNQERLNEYLKILSFAVGTFREKRCAELSLGKFKTYINKIIPDASKNYNLKRILGAENRIIYFGKTFLIYEVFKTFDSKQNVDNFNSTFLKEKFFKGVYSLGEFKEILKTLNINPTEENVNNTIKKLGYNFKSNNVILDSSFGSLIDYYRSQLENIKIYNYCDENFKEYDSIIKRLNKELSILEVEPGIFVTKLCLNENGINDKEIKIFTTNVRKIGRKYKFFSCKTIYNELKNNKVLDFCNNSEYQLVQFIKSIKGIKSVKIDNNYIFSYTNTKKLLNSFLHYLLGTKNCTYIGDFEDKTKKEFNIKYNIDKIIRDLKNSTLYFSEEMEKVYKNKQCYIKEVYHNEN